VKRDLRTYESVVVIDSLIKSEEINAIIEKIERIISNNGGKILEIDRWGKRRLAYEIKKRQYGYYVDFIFEAPSNLINVLERDYGLDENILRYLTVHLNKRALEHKAQQKLKETEGQKVTADVEIEESLDKGVDAIKSTEVKSENVETVIETEAKNTSETETKVE